MFRRNVWFGLFLFGVFSLLHSVPGHAQDYERIITRAYEDILGRKPDPNGMRHFLSRMIDEQWDETRVRAALRESEEFRLRQIDIVLNRAYEDLLRRKPDPEGRETYRNRMLSNGWDEQRVRRDIMDSEEFRRRH
ncbi:DUF4214 domain-containing protein [Desulfonatronum parangueonense]